MMKPISVSFGEAGRLIGGNDKPLSDDTVRRMIARGELEAIKIGHRSMVLLQSIEDCIASAPRMAA